VTETSKPCGRANGTNGSSPPHATQRLSDRARHQAQAQVAEGRDPRAASPLSARNSQAAQHSIRAGISVRAAGEMRFVLSNQRPHEKTPAPRRQRPSKPDISHSPRRGAGFTFSAILSHSSEQVGCQPGAATQVSARHHLNAPRRKPGRQFDVSGKLHSSSESDTSSVETYRRVNPRSLSFCCRLWRCMPTRSAARVTFPPVSIRQRSR